MAKPDPRSSKARTVVLAAALLTGLAVLAAVPPEPANPPAAQTTQPAQPAASTPQPAAPAAPRPAAAPVQTPAAPPAAANPGPASTAPSPQRFVPTEQVRADFDVSFPIDI